MPELLPHTGRDGRGRKVPLICRLAVRRCVLFIIIIIVVIAAVCLVHQRDCLHQGNCAFRQHGATLHQRGFGLVTGILVSYLEA